MLSILGGCTTRDIFRLSKSDDLVDDLWARTTVPSIMSPPIPSLMYDEDYSSSTFEGRQSIIDTNKTFFKHFSASRPRILLMDFMSEIYNLGTAEGGVVTMADVTAKRTAELGIRLHLIPPFGEERMSMMIRSLPGFFGKLNGEFGTSILVHEIYQSESFLAQGGEVTSFSPETIRKIHEANRHLRRVYAFIRAEFPNVVFFRGDDALAVADGAHTWGLSPFHMSAAYSLSALYSLRKHVNLPGQLAELHG